MSELTFRAKRGLSDDEFRRFLELVRKIAEYDAERKQWIFTPEKAARNFREFSEFEELLEELLKYSILRGPEEVLDEFKDYLDSLNKVPLDLKDFSFRLPRRVSKEVFNELRKHCFYSRGTFKIKSIRFLKDVEEALAREGLRLDYDPKLLEEVVNEYFTCTVERVNGMIKLKFRVLDSHILAKLREVCTFSYFIEKAIFDEEGNFVDTELRERKITFLEYDHEEASVRTSVGLLDRVLVLLRKEGFKIENKIVELPSFKLEITPNFKLMPHQRFAYEKWAAKKRGTIAIFTRGGKSFIAMQAIADLRKPTIILVTTKELALTWRNYLQKYLGLKPRSTGYLGEGIQKLEPITIAIYNSAVKYIDLIKEKFELAIFDECHHVPATTFKEVALRIGSLFRMALSATPRRRDHNEVLLYALCGDLLVNIDYPQLLQLRIVAPIEVYKTFFAADENEKLKTLDEIVERHKDGKIIVFTQYIDTAKRVYSHLLQKGHKVALITGSTKSDKRKFYFQAFVKGIVNIIITTTVLDEGITVPDADVAVIYEGSGEPRQMIQRIGRVLGYLPGKTAKIYELINISDPREKRAYFKRKWVRELYLVPELKKFLKGKEGGLYFQTKLEDFR